MARIERLRVYPVKGLDGVALDESGLTPGGTLEHDREYALFDAEGERINGKWSDGVHRVRTGFDPETHALSVRAVGEDEADAERFVLADQRGRERAANWFGDFFGEPVELRRNTETGFVDRPTAGPSVISTATIETVAGWFDDISVEGLRRRLRANVEVSGVPAFWEDRFVGADAPTFAAGDVELAGAEPCARCVVPERDPDTGERTGNFRQAFVKRRRETFPAFADPEAFDHYYTLMLIARVVEASPDATLAVGDPVAVRDRVSRG
ncbi:MAG: MOSC domain-containing protein [Haloarculaceae archaeon]